MRTRLWPLFLLPLLAACRPVPTLMVLQDIYSAELPSARELAPARLAETLRGRYRVRVELLDPRGNPGEEAGRRIRDRRPAWVYLSPLLPLDAGQLAIRSPEVRFLREQEEAPRAPNLVRLEFRREEAFRAAGSAVAGMLPSLPAPEYRPAKAGFLLAVSQPRAEREAAAFREGFAARADPSLLVQRVIGSTADTAQARRVLEDMKQEGVAVFVLKTYALTGFCLEHLRAQGGFAVLEEPAGTTAYAGQVVLYLEEDLSEVLRRLPIKEAETAGGVRLVRGPAFRQLPVSAQEAAGVAE